MTGSPNPRCPSRLATSPGATSREQLGGEQRVDERTATHRGFLDGLLRTVGDVRAHPVRTRRRARRSGRTSGSPTLPGTARSGPRVPHLPDDPRERLGGRMILRSGGRGRSLEHVDMDGRAGCFGGCGGVALNPSHALQRELLAAAPVASTSSAATLAGQCPSSDKAAARQDAASRRVAPAGRGMKLSLEGCCSGSGRVRVG